MGSGQTQTRVAPRPGQTLTRRHERPAAKDEGEEFVTKGPDAEAPRPVADAGVVEGRCEGDGYLDSIPTADAPVPADPTTVVATRLLS